ncbi:RhtB (resistance to homoserine/threonine) family protein [Cytobacillus oceanisediminis]|uniref:RhtB (Resistance to homoserine/threonine) family protein n=1 Tax=Cytobacillus oceanisediminis TaxID=665099 RepID=A0A2V3A445_9BACI|nr:LysE family translocator [Cytobacillus oceanisediminis]PWW28314.1 RhtB (resistance to homoserine/threonine) family protein [Cytobacillus oceanisediminis]
MENFLLFLFMSFLLVILPGPDTGILIQNTISSGKKSGVKTMFGSVAGLLVHTMAVVFGLSALIVKSAYIFSIIKYAGAMYLIYLGVVSLKSLSTQRTQTEGVKKHRKNKSHFLQGFFTCVSNPKVAVFFLTFFPQFVSPGENHFVQFLTMGFTYSIITIVWFFFYVYLIDFFRNWLKKPAVNNVLQGISGVVLMGFGIKLALEKQP